MCGTKSLLLRINKIYIGCYLSYLKIRNLTARKSVYSGHLSSLSLSDVLHAWIFINVSNGRCHRPITLICTYDEDQTLCDFCDTAFRASHSRSIFACSKSMNLCLSSSVPAARKFTTLGLSLSRHFMSIGSTSDRVF